MRALLMLVPLTVVTGCDGGFDLIADGPFPVFSETTTTKKLTITLDNLHPVQRFVVPAGVAPSSFDAHVDVSVERADRSFLIEFVDAVFSSDDPRTWAFGDVGFSFGAASAGSGDDLFQLSIARQPDDTDIDVSIDFELTLAAPTDVDFDGIDDDVTVVLGSLAPVGGL